MEKFESALRVSFGKIRESTLRRLFSVNCSLHFRFSHARANINAGFYLTHQKLTKRVRMIEYIRKDLFVPFFVRYILFKQTSLRVRVYTAPDSLRPAIEMKHVKHSASTNNVRTILFH